MAAVGSRSISCEPRDRVPTPWIACAWYLEDLLLGRGPGRRTAVSPSGHGRRAIVLGEAPSAAFALRNRSTARPSVRCSKESVAHVRVRPESGAQRSGESGAHCIESPPWRLMPAPVQTTRCCVSRVEKPQHVVGWLARQDSNLESPDPESVGRIRPREPRSERGRASVGR